MATKFFSYTGRLNRRPYFLMSLVLFVVFVLIGISVFIFSLTIIVMDSSFLSGFSMIMVLFQLLALFLSSFIVVRRFHDLDKDWYYVFLLLVPILNVIVCLILTFVKGTEGPNRFGPDPLAKETVPEIPVPVPSLPQE